MRGCIGYVHTYVHKCTAGAPNEAHRSLLLSVLIPLHRPSGRLDETTPHLALYQLVESGA